MKNQDVINQLVNKTLSELSLGKRDSGHSRNWSSSRGYRFLVQWSNAVLLRILVRKFTVTLPKSEYRTKTQLDDSARSVVSNLEEGYKRATTGEYLKFIGFSQGSLEEIHGLINQCQQDRFIKSSLGSKLSNLGINLKAWNDYCKNPLNSSKILYFPLVKGRYRNLKEIKGEDLTYEIFIELINKTDYLLRKLVVSLEQKIQTDKLKLL